MEGDAVWVTPAIGGDDFPDHFVTNAGDRAPPKPMERIAIANLFGEKGCDPFHEHRDYVNACFQALRSSSR